MSGRKASEVNTLLRNGEKTRSASMDILNDAYKNAQSACRKLKKVYDETEKEFLTAELVVSDEAKKEFPDAAEKLELECRKFINEFSDSRKTYILDVNDRNYKNLLSKYASVDSKADNIRKLIADKIRSSGRSDPWYCDSEYAAARNIETEYRNLSSEVSSMRSTFSSVCTRAANNEAIISSRKAQLRKLRKSIDDLTQKAEKAIETRKHANSVKNAVQKEFNDIDSAVAEKFLADGYSGLSAEVENFMKKSDNDVINSYSGISNKISVFCNELNKVYSAFLERQGQIKAMIDNVSERLDNRIFSNPEDEFKPENKRGEKMSLCTFLKQYSDTDYPSLISGQLSKINSMYVNEEFDKAETALSTLGELIEKASDKAVTIHQNMKKTIFNMLSIKKVMLKMNYDVKVVKNGNFLNDGYCIECTAGDEIIKYDRVSVVDDGTPVIDIDHKESSKGTCGSKWKDIRSELSGEGLIIEDITKNGRSIFGTPPASAQSENILSTSTD